jgi:hypothetical protein
MSDKATVGQRSKFMAYHRGWSDGANVRAMRDEFKDHPLLAESCNEGYGDGRKARTEAHVAASERFGVKLSVLRSPGWIVPDDSESTDVR